MEATKTDGGGVVTEDAGVSTDARNVTFSTTNPHTNQPKMLSSDMRGMSVAKPDARFHMISRIPTRVELRTLTHLAKRPAINIDFKEVSYSVRHPLGTNGASKFFNNYLGLNYFKICSKFFTGSYFLLSTFLILRTLLKAFTTLL